MMHDSKQYRRVGRFRGSLLTSLLVLPFGACNTDELTDATNPAGLAEPVSEVEAPSFASSFRGGIPIGTFAQPTSAFGTRFNGALRLDWPDFLLKELAAIKARGGKVALTFSGNDRHFLNRSGHFDLGKWKARVDRYKKVKFASYINDGTIIGHYLLDEPNDKTNWNGKAVPPSTVEEMARYSKQLWPTLPTIVRAEPGYLANNHRYLDAAWAQYVHRKGTAANYIRRNVADAQKRGLGLVVGMNLLKGGPKGRQINAKELKEWGSTLLSGSYPCAFISWTYNKSYISRSDVAAAMSHLAGKARSKSAKSCRGAKGGGGGGGGGGGVGSVGDKNSGSGSVGGGSGSAGITLKVTGRQRNRRQFLTLTWSRAKGSVVYLYRNNNYIGSTRNDGRYVDTRNGRNGTYRYRVCHQRNGRDCSKTVTVTVR